MARPSAMRSLRVVRRCSIFCRFAPVGTIQTLHANRTPRAERRAAIRTLTVVMRDNSRTEGQLNQPRPDADPPMSFQLQPIGVIRSSLKSRKNAPRQGSEGAPEAWLEIHSFAAPAVEGLVKGDEIIVLTWLHES